MTTRAVLVCRDAQDAKWQLGPLPPAQGILTLIGWTRTANEPDSGVPQDVARVLARALTSVARVTFPSSRTDVPATTVWSTFDDGVARALTGQRVIDRALGKIRGASSHRVLISTRSVELATQAFDDAEFPWWLQGQGLLLSPIDAAPPDIDEPALIAVFEDDWAAQAARLARVDVRGVVRPGVDGAVLGVLCLDAVFDRSILDALARETHLAGLTWSVVPESGL